MRLLACLVILLLAALPAAAAPLTIRVGYAGPAPGGTRYVPGLAGIVAAERYIEREIAGDPDLAVEWVFFKGAGPAVNEALAGGQLDFAFMGDLPSLSGRAAGLDTRIVMATNARDALYLVTTPASSIKGLSDLKGRKVAQFRGTSTHLASEGALQRAGLTSRDLQVYALDDASALAALAAGDVEAVLGKALFLTLVERGQARVAWSSKGDPRAGPSNHLIVAGTFERAHPDLVARVVKASVRAAAWASDEANREAVFALWEKSGTPAAVFRADYDGQRLAERLSPLVDDLLIDTYREKAARARDLSLVRRAVDVTGWFEPIYVDAAIRDLGLAGTWTRYGADGRPLGS